jgi:phage-related protein
MYYVATPGLLFMNRNMHMARSTHPIAWIGPTLTELRALPQPVRRDIAQALYAAQQGIIDPAATPLRSYSYAQSMQIVERYRSQRYRAIYRSFADAIHVSRIYRDRKKTSNPGHRSADSK